MHSSLRKAVILIDDDPVANMISVKLIERIAPMKVVAFSNAEAALRYISDPKTTADTRAIIFLDINMPQMDGWQFLEAFQKLDDCIRRNCTIFMLTSSIDTADIRRSQTYPAVKDFVSKPLTQERLRGILED